LTSLPREFSEPLYRRMPEMSPLATRVIWRAETGSTNVDAAMLAESGAPEGAVVLADHQTAGRGRLGRSWSSPPGVGIYASVLLRPEAQVAGLLSIAAGVAISEAIEDVTGLGPMVKWPNDVYLDGGGAHPPRKVAGILAEGGTSDAGTWVVIGFGINVLPGAHPPEITRATSIETELGRAVDRGELTAACLVRLAGRYTDLKDGRRRSVLDAWRTRATAMLGRRVEWDEGGAVLSGIVADIDDEGGLLVSTDAGAARIVSGEVRWP
jgi:BirA family biotin operon repressor/biotin-[acetyl-CoA-carboxylase] ligase